VLAAIKPAMPGTVKQSSSCCMALMTVVTPEQIEAFKKELKDAGADFRFIAYPGAIHGFTNPDADGWEEIQPPARV
jgi:dienelactone hydrolase